jgi:hypothetical protein
MGAEREQVPTGRRTEANRTSRDVKSWNSGSNEEPVISAVYTRRLSCGYGRVTR